MRGRWCRLCVGLMLLLPFTPALAQARWTKPDARALLGVIAASAEEGLRPADYGADAIEQALAREDPLLDDLADPAALALAHDYYEGRTPAAQRRNWQIARGRIDYRPWLDAVLQRHSVSASYAALLPASPAYRGLRAALATCTEGARCSTIAANLERWRWLPRTLEPRYLWVNIPAFRLDLIENGAIISRHKIIVGKPGTRTPVFRALVTGVTINPWWNVPCSIVDESIGKLVRQHPDEAARRGFVARVDRKGVLQVRQKPGPENALGQIKLEMPNPYNVYIHDTPSRSLFDKDKRALSHGCIRTEDPADLARTILGGARSWEIDTLLITGASRTLALAQPVPVYIVYLTAEPDPDKEGAIATFGDIYAADASLGAR